MDGWVTYALVGQDGSAVDVEFVLDGDIVSEDGDVLNAALRSQSPRYARKHSPNDRRCCSSQ
jgi:hypothetical protein